MSEKKTGTIVAYVLMNVHTKTLPTFSTIKISKHCIKEYVKVIYRFLYKQHTTQKLSKPPLLSYGESG